MIEKPLHFNKIEKVFSVAEENSPVNPLIFCFQGKMRRKGCMQIGNINKKRVHCALTRHK